MKIRMVRCCVCVFSPTTPQWSGIGWWDLSKALRHLSKATFHVVAKLPSFTYTLAW